MINTCLNSWWKYIQRLNLYLTMAECDPSIKSYFLHIYISNFWDIDEWKNIIMLTTAHPVAIFHNITNLNYLKRIFNKKTEQSGVKKGKTKICDFIGWHSRGLRNIRDHKFFIERRNIFPSLCSGQLQTSSNKIL